MSPLPPRFSRILAAIGHTIWWNSNFQSRRNHPPQTFGQKQIIHEHIQRIDTTTLVPFTLQCYRQGP